jgi:hypothetical protein
MKLKLLFVLLIAAFLMQPSFAKDKGTAKIGPVFLKNVNNRLGNSISAILVANTYQISLSATSRLSSGIVHIYLPADIVFSKGQEFDVTSSGDQATDSANIHFLVVQKKRIKGSSAVMTGYFNDNGSEATGKLTVVSYNPETKELKFILFAQVAPYIRTVDWADETITQPIQVTANIVVTLP